VNLAQPVAIDANSTYVVSYNSQGRYSSTANFFTADINSGHLRALSSTSSGGNGVFAYGSSGAFPSSSWNNTNYYVDVAFQPQLAA